MDFAYEKLYLTMPKIIVLSLDYLTGLFETDGSTSIIFKKDCTMATGYLVYPVVVFTQKNQQLLKCISKTLDQHGISYTVENNERKGRGSNIKIAGIRQTKRFYELCFGSALPVSESALKRPMFGQKYLDLLKMQYFFDIVESSEHNTPSGRAKIIDLKYSLHQHRVEVPLGMTTYRGDANSLANSNSSKARIGFSREVWEGKHNLPPGSSIGAARDQIADAHRKYELYKEHMLQKTTSELRSEADLHPDYISGIIEGDGCITLGCLQRRGLSFPRFTASFKIVMEEGGELLLHVVAKYFFDDRPYIARDRVKASCYYHTSRRSVLTSVSEHLVSHPVFFKRKEAHCLAEILSVWDLTRAPAGQPSISESKVRQIVKQIYATGTLRDGLRGPFGGARVSRRKKSLEQVLEELSLWYSKQ